MKLILTLLLILLCGLGVAQSKKHKPLRTHKCDTVTFSYCWKNVPAKAFSYINESRDLKWIAISDTDRFYQVDTRCTRWTERIKEKGKWALIRWSFDFGANKEWFRDMDLYYLNDKPIKPIDIKIKDNWVASYTGYFKDLTNPFKK